MLALFTQLDAFSLYDGLAPGADSAATGIVALLAVAEALGQVKELFTDADRPIMLSFFHGVSPCLAQAQTFVAAIDLWCCSQSLDGLCFIWHC